MKRHGRGVAGTVAVTGNQTSDWDMLWPTPGGREPGPIASFAAVIDRLKDRNGFGDAFQSELTDLEQPKPRF
jgi:hypothetical protein